MVNSLFVYGTLKPGFSNFPIIEHLGGDYTISKAMVDHCYLLKASFVYYPFAFLSNKEHKLYKNNKAKGYLIEFNNSIDTLLAFLDKLEGIENSESIYKRTQVTCVTVNTNRKVDNVYMYALNLPPTTPIEFLLKNQFYLVENNEWNG